MLKQDEKFEEAINLFEQILEKNPADYKIMSDLGWACVLAKQWNKAEKILEKAICLAPKSYVLPKNCLEELNKRRAV